jgi:HlyD family secretion protein
VWSKRKWIWSALAVLILGTVGISLFAYVRGRGTSAAAAPPAQRPNGVACLGHIEPKDGVMRVAAPYFEGRPALVEKLLVQQGDRVQAGQTLAMLDGRAKLEAAAGKADAEVLVARRRLEQVKAGAKPEDRAAQQAEVKRAESVAENARREYERYEKLYLTHDVTGGDVDEKRTAAEASQRSLDAARARLQSLENVRPEDVAMAESELQAAIAASKEARASLDSTRVKAPVAGLILQIHAHSGEQVTDLGILDLARTDQMYIVADVYETDISRVRVGSRADITSDLFPGSLEGKVELVGRQVTPGEVMPSDPMAFVDRRVVPVKIRLAGQEASGFIHGKVSVRIEP